MESIIICNTASDVLSKIDVEKFCCENYFLKLGGERKGPRGIGIYGEKAIIANCYDSSIIISDLKSLKEEERYEVGKYPKDIKVYKDYLYIACGESNSINVFNLKTNTVDFDIKVGDYPSKLQVNDKVQKLYVSNMNGNSIDVIDLTSNRLVDTFLVNQTPTGIGVSEDGKSIYVCQSSFGYEHKNMITVHLEESFKIIDRIKVGLMPSDICIKKNKLYTANLGDGTISIVDLNLKNEEKRIKVGGMPRSILSCGKYIFIADYYNGRIIRIDEKSGERKNIAVGIEPNAMILT